ncbi:MAG: hypothetical protein K5979_12425 [Ruminococcus sp.]|nr:hypothetical protein [Ruminococcus sp.]
MIIRKLFYEYIEAIPAFLLLTMRAVLPKTFTVGYLVFLGVCWFIKNRWLNSKTNSYRMSIPDSILGLALMLSETSVVFLEYSLGKLSTIYFILLIVIILSLLISFRLMLYTEKHDSLAIKVIIKWAGFAALLIGFGTGLIKSIRHDSIEVFRVSDILLMIFCAIHYFNHNNYSTWKRAMKALIYLVVLPSLPIFGLILLSHELGTVMVLALTYLFFLLIMGIATHKWAISGSVVFILVLLVAVWINLYNNPSRQVLIEAFLENITGHNFTQQLNRIFIRYADFEQITLTNDIAFGKLLYDNRGKTAIIADMVLRFMSAPEYREIVPFEDNHYTSSADFCFSVFTYTNPIFSIVIFSLSMIIYLKSIVNSIAKECTTFIIPLSIFIIQFVHIAGNMLVFPFTGIPTPYLSYGKTAVLANAFLAILYVVVEKNNSNDVKFKR